jgi:hypothetical protein
MNMADLPMLQDNCHRHLLMSLQNQRPDQRVPMQEVSWEVLQEGKGRIKLKDHREMSCSLGTQAGEEIQL